MHPLTFILDTGSDPNLIHMTYVCPTWRQDIEPFPVPQLCAAGRQPLAILGVLPLFVTTRDFPVKETFAVVDGLVTGALLSTSFLNKDVKQIYPTVKRLQPVNSRAIPILSRDTTATDDSAVLSAYHPLVPQFFRVSRKVLAQPCT